MKFASNFSRVFSSDPNASNFSLSIEVPCRALDSKNLSSQWLSLGTNRQGGRVLVVQPLSIILASTAEQGGITHLVVDRPRELSVL
jgi:hypothetical protein